MNEENPRTMAAILADIADLGPFLPGSVRKDHRKYVNKRGETVVYEVQARLSYPVDRGKFKDKRFPAKAFERVRKLTENYKRFRALVAELEEAAVREYLPGSKKKNLSRSRR